MLDIEQYRIVYNIPKSLMGYPVAYCVPDTILAGIGIDGILELIRNEHVDLSSLTHYRSDYCTYIGARHGMKNINQSTDFFDDIKRIIEVELGEDIEALKALVNGNKINRVVSLVLGRLGIDSTNQEHR